MEKGTINLDSITGEKLWEYAGDYTIPDAIRDYGGKRQAARAVWDVLKDNNVFMDRGKIAKHPMQTVIKLVMKYISR